MGPAPNKEKEIRTTSDNLSVKKVFRKSIIKKGILYFVLLSLSSFTLLFIYTNTGKTLEVITNLHIEFILLAIGMSILDMWLGGWRNHIFARVLKPGIKQEVCQRANVANVFMGAVTPSQSGGGAAQLYILYRSGINLTQGLTISLINWFSTLLFFPLSAGIALYFIKDQFSSNTIYYLLQSGFSLFGTLFFIIVIAFWKPLWVGKLVLFLSEKMGIIHKKWQKKWHNWGKAAYQAIQVYQQNCEVLLQENPWLLPYSFLITLLLYFNKFCLAYVLVLGLGVAAPFWIVIAIQVIIMFILYFAPSPGASGIAEISIAALMSHILAEHLLPFFTVLHRLFLLFIPAIIGAFVVLNELRVHAKE